LTDYIVIYNIPTCSEFGAAALRQKSDEKIRMDEKFGFGPQPGNPLIKQMFEALLLGCGKQGCQMFSCYNVLK
jgi:hypothetical protein